MLEYIQNSLNAFSQGNLTDNALNLFQTLGYESERRLPFDEKSFADFENYVTDESNFNEKNALASEWRYVDLLFQLTEHELTNQVSMFDTREVNKTRIESYLFFTLELPEKKADGKEFTRTDLANITREINKPFLMPAFVLFKCGGLLTLSVVNRRLHKRDETKDVLLKVTLIKDIDFQNPKRSHLEILKDLSFDELLKKHKFQNFVELHKAWTATLDTKELNKRFFRELSNWYFWAVSKVAFPKAPNDTDSEETHHAKSVIRLITRLMFVWFLKEKGLISDELFNERELKNVLSSNFSLRPPRFAGGQHAEARTQNEARTENSSYYKAILQNLFFATLNTDGTDSKTPRKFRAKKSEKGWYNGNQGVHNVFRYENEFINPQKTLEKYFLDIPFLNGGLFECLDKSEEKIYVDGFSERKDNVLSVPDELFYCDECIVDLSEVYNDGKKSKEKVRGLIRILDNYKFTIAENTPIEEEIALDPELLGKVFENLLANYNPETRTTARKQTGSFYTPREIVNYMVDESLIAYLKAKLQTETQGFSGFVAFGENQPTMFGNEMRVQQKFEMPVSGNRWLSETSAAADGLSIDKLETALRDLFKYDEIANQFNETETEILIKAINDCKILDPACGSGAFPMGILQRLVFLLGKLDKDNVKWRELQRQIALQETDEAFKIGDVKEREKRLIEINEVFENNASDYGRKLFLIENCIYGVDIQPVAIQISKLRFFISLIIDQKIDDSRPNRGVRPLPNLETKLVSANTLLGLTAQRMLKPAKLNEKKDRKLIDELEDKLQKARKEIFRARTPSTKLKWRERDKEIRADIADLLKEVGNPPDAADKIANWSPDNQDAHVDWFDAEWMFGIEKGFDIVIGNPPYVQIQKFDDKQKKLWEAQKYETYSRTSDIYCLFYERAWQQLKSKGVLSFITPNTWLQSITFNKIRFFLTNNFQWNCILITDKIFDATVDTHSIVFQKRKPNDKECLIYLKDKEDITFSHKIKSSNISKSGGSININKHSKEKDLYERIFIKNTTLKNYCDVFNGVKPFEKGKGNPPQTVKTMETKPFVAEGYQPDKEWKPLLRGRLINRYVNLWNKNYWILYGQWLAAPRNPEIFDADEKVVVRQTGDSLIGTIVEKGIICRNNLHILLPKESVSSKYVLSLINSKIMDFIYSIMNPEKGEALAEVKKNHIEQLPIPKATDEQQAAIAEIVDEIIEAKKADAKANTSKLEAKIDNLVFDLYELTEDERDIVRGKV